MERYKLKFEQRLPIIKLDSIIMFSLGLYKHDVKNRKSEQKVITPEDSNYSNVILIRSYRNKDYIIPLYAIKCTIPNRLRTKDITNPVLKDYELLLLNCSFDNLENVLEKIKEEYRYNLEDL